MHISSRTGCPASRRAFLGSRESEVSVPVEWTVLSPLRHSRAQDATGVRQEQYTNMQSDEHDQQPRMNETDASAFGSGPRPCPYKGCHAGSANPPLSSRASGRGRTVANTGLFVCASATARSAFISIRTHSAQWLNSRSPFRQQPPLARGSRSPVVPVASW